ncbi:MAG TPA: hypothetical protein VIG24_02140 [Acidimicrobiia bacterium]
MIRLAVPLIAALSIGGCGTLMPQYDDPSMRFVEPGRYEVCSIYEVKATPEEVALRCNHGIPGGDALGCTFTNASPRIVVVPVLQKVNDQRALYIWGHESVHGVFGDWHTDAEAR